MFWLDFVIQTENEVDVTEPNMNVLCKLAWYSLWSMFWKSEQNKQEI